MKKTLLFFLLLLLIIKTNQSCSEGSEFFHIKQDPFKIHSSIYIEGNVNFTATAIAEKWSGDGTREFPFLIEGYNITSSTETIIEIVGSALTFFEGGN